MGLREEEFLKIDRQWKLQSLIRGYRRRTREDWERTRLLMFTVSRIAGGKAETVQEFFPLPYDKVEKTEEELQEEQKQLEQLMKECQEYNAAVDKKEGDQ